MKAMRRYEIGSAPKLSFTEAGSDLRGKRLVKIGKIESTFESVIGYINEDDARQIAFALQDLVGMAATEASTP